MNAKYTTAQEIISMVTALAPGKKLNPADAIEWAAQCEIEYIRNYHYFVRYLKVKLEVKDHQARMPYFKARILDVYEDPDKPKSLVNYYDSGAYIVLDSNYTKDHVYVNFIGIPIDQETGLPLIKRGHEDACVYHILHNLYLEDFINGKIEMGRFQYIVEERRTMIRAAQGRITDFDRKDLDELAAITLNMLPVVRYGSLYHEGMGR